MRGRSGPPDAVRHECVVAVVLPSDVREEAHVELFGGRPRYSVGGALHEGVRWWSGRVDLTAAESELRAGTELRIEMDDGRSAIAVIVEDAPEGHRVFVRGVGPPPFDVP